MARTFVSTPNPALIRSFVLPLDIVLQPRKDRDYLIHALLLPEKMRP